MTPRHRTKTVLIIEDEADIRNLVFRLLELEGYHTLQAEDGETGLTLARESRAALVLLDLRLPKCDGWAVLKQMKSEPELSAIPVIVFTASASISQRKRALTMGAVDYLVKPLSVASLKEAVARAMRRKR